MHRVIRMRYVEIESQLRKLIMVVKMRGGLHSKDIGIRYFIKRDFDRAASATIRASPYGHTRADFCISNCGTP
jgi:hypothetical protein